MGKHLKFIVGRNLHSNWNGDIISHTFICFSSELWNKDGISLPTNMEDQIYIAFPLFTSRLEGLQDGGNGSTWYSYQLVLSWVKSYTLFETKVGYPRIKLDRSYYKFGIAKSEILDSN